MTVDYKRLDEVYKEFPEILDLVKAAAWVSQEGYNLQFDYKPEERIRHAIRQLRTAGRALDNRNH